ncbi:MAG TPA: hypothetical protein VLM89_13730 [Phycisphaerae bacterium]|nr:hypothetical protein [Phycisphaerae bacterium]
MTTIRVNADPKEPLARFIEAVDAWQQRHGYENAWSWPELEDALRKLNAPAVNSALSTQFTLDFAPDPKLNASPYEQLQAMFRRTESYTPRLINGMKQALQTMK